MEINIKQQVIDDIFRIAVGTRKYLQTEKTFCNFQTSPFPYGWCRTASEQLKEDLKYHLNIDAIIKVGDLYPFDITRYNHAWLEYEGLSIDITADQFNDLGYRNPEVIVTDNSIFHSEFTLQKLSSSTSM